MLKKLSLVVLILLMFETARAAGFMFAPSITYMQQEYSDGLNEADTKLTIIDLKLGYTFDMGLFIGGLYSLQDHDLLTDSSDSFFGPTIGYSNSGFFVAGTYYIYGEKDFTDGSAKLSNVQGFQIDLTYGVPVTDTLLIGPQLTFHSYKFKETQVAGVASETDQEFSGLTPYFALMFLY